MNILEARGLRQIYKGRIVLDIAQLEVRRGEILAIIGPSGAGKSTLLRLLNFLEPPTAGTIRFEGRPINGRAPLDVRRQITTVFQRPALLRASVRANVSYGLRLRGLRDDAEVDALLHRLGLADLATSPAHTLSGGEMQRVALARALAIRPRVLLLDEPTTNLDPYNAALIEQVIREANSAEGTTVVLVTHDLFQARRLAHRSGLLLGGRLIELAPTETFFGAPSDPRTMAFLRGELVY
ncbi:MAG: ATP-binding cassette domain-containing protein [Anaerolineae bacterium]